MSVKKYTVYFIEQAEIDLYEIYTYVMDNDCERAAVSLLDKIEQQCEKLKMMPERGNIPRELKRFGISEYRELQVKPHRIIYQIINKQVYIHAILDGRRDLEDHMMRRLL